MAKIVALEELKEVLSKLESMHKSANERYYKEPVGTKREAHIEGKLIGYEDAMDLIKELLNKYQEEDKQ